MSMGCVCTLDGRFGSGSPLDRSCGGAAANGRWAWRLIGAGGGGRGSG